MVAHATTVGEQSKARSIRRALVGLGTMGVKQVLVMPERLHLGQRAIEGLDVQEAIPAVEMLEMPVTNEGRDSQWAASLLHQAGAGCILVLGGDGTMRAVAKGAGDTPLLPLSTGTNNVLPSGVEETVAGLAAGAVAQEVFPLQEVAFRHKWLEVSINGDSRDRALVDVAALRGHFVGSGAVWKVENVQQIVVTRGDANNTGLSAIAGVVRPVAPKQPKGVALSLSPEAHRHVLAPIGPGLILPVGIKSARVLAAGDTVTIIAEESLVLALDGERELVVQKTDRVAVTLHLDGPWIVEPHRVIERMTAQRLFDISA
ncbi:MAG: NAD(+)/NADH kinase [Chloroflexota bacterium]|nr:NAD(+)/NADH kinase [Chloroflexota bacterium]